ncbi:hypothetical protein B0O80DRAFT_47884 [Mortierella sp. GBAus27b]|nr:hypothetical protein B0O80DRAFT_47884 [Mortierella sp. GBAus27b]
MPAALLDEFQSLLTSDRNVYLTLREMLLRLPRSNYNVLSYLCHHLSKIATHSDKTKMTVSNLALVFAPTLGIGHVLFQALLGNFHESGNTPENKENGLQLVWGDHMQDHGYDSTEWLDTDAEKEEYETLSSGLLHRHSMPVGERGLFNRGIAALSASYGEMSLQDLDKQSRNRRTLASPISSSVLSYDSLGEAGLSEEVRLMKTMLQREGSGVTSSTLDSENVEATIENEEKKLMDEMLQREANEPISTTILISESLGVAIENEESRLMQDMLEREEMAVKSGLEYSPPPPAAAVTSSNTSSTTNLPSHLTSTAIVRNEVTNIADLGASLPSTDMPIAPQGADMSNVTIKAGAMTPTPLNNPSPKEPVSVTPDVLGAGAMIDSNTSFREPLSLNSVPGTITPFQGVSVAV